MFVGFSSNDNLIFYPIQSYSGLLCSSCAAGAPTQFLFGAVCRKPRKSTFLGCLMVLGDLLGCTRQKLLSLTLFILLSWEQEDTKLCLCCCCRTGLPIGAPVVKLGQSGTLLLLAGHTTYRRPGFRNAPGFAAGTATFVWDHLAIPHVGSAVWDCLGCRYCCCCQQIRPLIQCSGMGARVAKDLTAAIVSSGSDYPPHLGCKMVTGQLEFCCPTIW